MTVSDSGRRLIDGRFELLERLGGGGMGLVWRTRDTALHREVALKEVRQPEPDLADADPEAAAKLRERVLREARALARVHHPNVATIQHIVDRTDLPHPWLVMELVTGGSLRDLLAGGPLTPRDAAVIGRGVLAGLRAAHAVGVHHRDVKPANVLLRPDRTPVLTDFGIATLRDSTRLTTTGGLIGSPEYIAPERIRGEEGNPASDLWSLGMLLYVAVEGVHPLRRETSIATLVAVLDEPLPPPVRSGPLAPVLSALLVRDAAARPDAERLDRMLADVERGGTPAPAPSPVDAVPAGFGPAPASYQPLAPHAYYPPAAPTRPTPVPPPRRGGRALAAAGTVAAVAVAGVLVWNLAPGLHDGGDAGATETGGARTTTGSRSSGAPTTAGPTASAAQTTASAPKNLLTPAGVRRVIAAMRPYMGSSKVKEFTVYADHAEAEAPTRTDPKLYDDLTYRDGQVTRAPGGTLEASDAQEMQSLDGVNWNALPALMARAQKTLDVPHPTLRYLTVDHDLFDGARVINLYLSDAYGSGYLSAYASSGKVKETHPRGGS
ncbi:serine/threonine-protein kinase [Streptomyces sp. NPDC059718]